MEARARTRQRSHVPPHDLDAERAVVGALMVSDAAVGVASELVATEDFYSERHRLMFAAALELYGRGQKVDFVSLADALERRGDLEDAGGKGYLFQIIESVPVAANLERHAEIVRDKATLRRLMDVSARIHQEATSSPEDVNAVLESAERLLHAAGSARDRSGGFDRLGDVIGEVFEETQERYEAGGEVSGTSTGFADLDRLTSGLHDTDLVVLAARPAMGKTSLALNVLLSVASELDTAAAIFSLEMSKKQLAQRIISLASGVPASSIRTGQLSESEWGVMFGKGVELTKLEVYIDDDSGVTLSQIRSRARRLQAKLRSRGRRLGLVVVDYLQLMLGEKNRENRQQEVAAISRGLKVLARELDLPVLAVSQLSRACESRNDKRPMLSDLRDSGSVEQDADLVMFIYRDEYYNPASEDKGTAEVIVSKHRNGPTGKVRLAWIEDRMKFADLSRGG